MSNQTRVEEILKILEPISKEIPFIGYTPKCLPRKYYRLHCLDCDDVGYVVIEDSRCVNPIKAKCKCEEFISKRKSFKVYEQYVVEEVEISQVDIKIGTNGFKACFCYKTEDFRNNEMVITPSFNVFTSFESCQRCVDEMNKSEQKWFEEIKKEYPDTELLDNKDEKCKYSLHF